MRSYFDGGLLQLIGYRILGFLVTVLTLGIYALWLDIKLRQWKVSHTYFAGLACTHLWV